MGCDIHLVLERKWNDNWVGVNGFPGLEVDVWTNGESKAQWIHYRPSSRNYARFAKLAGVRGEGPDARGVPDDASELTRLELESWGHDGHSHSWCYLKEFVEACLATEGDPETMLDKGHPRTRDPYYHYFGIDEDRLEDEEYRVVFWFDN